jgi:acetyl esterase/lipase
VSDVRRALRYIRFNAAKFDVDPDRLGVFGNSAGGHLALMLGTMADNGDTDSTDPIEQTSARVAAVVAYYPPVDLRQTGLDAKTLEKLKSGPLDFDAALQESVSPILHVSGDDAPTLLVHGDKDTSVPLSNSERMHDAFRKSQVQAELIVMEGAGHAFPGQYGSRAASALADWFDQHLLDRPKQ